jgi:tripartite-type tricarboxylate transporter receptor subunit TctC
MRGAALRFGLLALAALACAGAMAQDYPLSYPMRPVRMVKPFAPGGGLDAQARIITQKLTDTWGQPVVLDARPGAQGAIGSQMVASATPDGYTLLFTNSSFATVTLMTDKPLFDASRDFAAVILVGVQPMILVAHPSMPATVADALALARKRPGQLNFASAGSTSQLNMELLKSMAKVDIVNVPYKGTAPAVTAMLGGEVQLAIFSANVIYPHVKAGKLRALGVTSKKRSPSFPDLPAIAESGVPGYETGTWSAILAPARTPRAIVAKLNSEVDRLLGQEDVRQRLGSLGVDAAGGSPEEFGTYLRAEIAKWSRLIKQTGVRVTE